MTGLSRGGTTTESSDGGDGTGCLSVGLGSMEGEVGVGEVVAVGVGAEAL